MHDLLAVMLLMSGCGGHQRPRKSIGWLLADLPDDQWDAAEHRSEVTTHTPNTGFTLPIDCLRLKASVGSKSQQAISQV
eukprot:4274527-Amphidinium_carterae.1